MNDKSINNWWMKNLAFSISFNPLGMRNTLAKLKPKKLKPCFIVQADAENTKHTHTHKPSPPMATDFCTEVQVQQLIHIVEKSSSITLYFLLKLELVSFQGFFMFFFKKYYYSQKTKLSKKIANFWQTSNEKSDLFINYFSPQ